jgi:hypothetical protein
MEDKVHARFKWIKRQVEADAEYLHLLQRLQLATPDFLAAVNTLSQEQRDSVYEYIGICAELSDRVTEIACYIP